MIASLYKWMCAVTCVFFYSGLTACALPSMMEDASSVSHSASSIVIVGKIEIVPPLDIRHEQKTHWNVIGDDSILNKIVMATGPEPEPVNTDIVLSQWQDAINAEIGKTYFVKGKRQRTYLRGAMVNLDVATQERLWFPGGFYFDIQKDADAVYIGTLRYTRNVFNEIMKVEVINDYNSTSKEFRGRYGMGVTLTQSLLKHAN